MVSTDDASVTRVKSRDGTEIAYWTSGDGPPLVLVSGMTADHTTWRALSPYLEPHATVHAMDRRGRGASGDGADYDLGREFEDVAAVVDAVAEVSGSAVDVLGHSFGGLCAFGGAALTTSLRRLVLYEGWPVTDPQDFPPGLEERLDALLAQGDREAVLEAFMREVVELSEDELSTFRAQPAWQNRLAAAHTITREHRTEAQAAFDPEQAAGITVPTLLLVGGDSPDHLKAGYEPMAAALPDVRISVLSGQQHAAHQLIPDVFAEHVFAFLHDRPYRDPAAPV